MKLKALKLTLLSLFFDECVQGRAITVGTLSDTFHQFETAVVVKLLRDIGQNVSTLGFPQDEGGTHPHDVIFSMFFNGTIDILPSVWLPDGHGYYVNPKQIGVDYDVLGTTSEEGVFYWGVSPAAAAAGISSLDDLVNPPADFDRFIRVPDNSTGLAMASLEIAQNINACQGSTANLTIAASFEEEVEFLDNHLNGNLKFAVGWWAPWWGNSVYKDLRRLSYGSFGDPFGRVNHGVTLVRPDVLTELPSSVVAAVSRIFIGNTAVIAGDVAVGYAQNETAFEAAAAWLGSNASGGGAYWASVLEAPSVDGAPIFVS